MGFLGFLSLVVVLAGVVALVLFFFSFLFERCVIFASRIKLGASPFPLLSLFIFCITANVVRVHHCQLDALLTLTLQTSVAGHRHPRRATKKAIPKRDLGLRASA